MGLGHPRHLVGRQGEAGELGAGGEQAGQRGQQADVGGRAVGDAGAQLDPGRISDQAFVHEGVDQPEMAGVEDLQLGLYADLPHSLGHVADHVRGADVYLVALAEVQRSAVDAAHVGPQGLDMSEALEAVHQVGPLGAELERVGIADEQVAAHPRGCVDDHVGVGRPHLRECLAIQIHVPGALAGGRIAHVNVHDGRTGISRLQRRGRDLRRRDRQVGCLPAVSPAPVTAQVMIGLRFTTRTLPLPAGRNCLHTGTPLGRGGTASERGRPGRRPGASDSPGVATVAGR